MKSGIGTEFLYLKGDEVTGHGEFVESMENGDKNVYKYEFFGTTKNGSRRTRLPPLIVQRSIGSTGVRGTRESVPFAT